MQEKGASPSPVVTIMICTCNRARDLEQTLVTIAGLCVPEDLPTELLVVDNGSTDDTAAVIRAFSPPNMSVRYLHEGRRGKGCAYNAGMAATRGEILLFTDDDVRLPQEWIAGMCRPILTGQADAVCGGVRLAPHLERPWMEDLHRSFLACTIDYDAETPPILIGANMAFHTRVLEKVPQYDIELGAGALGQCEDSLFSYQMKAAGFRLRSALHVVAVHHPSPRRLQRASFLATSAKLGRSTAYIDYHWEHKSDPAARRRYLSLLARRAFHRLRHRLPAGNAEGADTWEMGYVYSMFYYRQLSREQRRARQYERHGLAKKLPGC